MNAADIRTALTRPWKHGEAVEIVGETISEPVDLSGLSLCGVNFRNTVFTRGFLAHNTRFNGLSWFDGVSFGGEADFSGAQFVNDARFNGAQFQTGARFARCEFRGTANFKAIQCAALFDLSEASSYGNADFALAQLGTECRMSQAQFWGGLWAQDAVFPAQTKLDDTHIHGRLWLRRATLGNAPLHEDHFGMSFGYTYY